NSQHGKLTTRTFLPSSASFLPASMEIQTSDPLATIRISWSVSAFSQIVYAPFLRLDAGASSVRSKIGRFWRVSNKAVGPVLFSSAATQAYLVSVASEGRITVTFGVIRRLIRVSIG